jgi:DNA-binding MarR family transcriptional regulator
MIPESLPLGLIRGWGGFSDKEHAPPGIEVSCPAHGPGAPGKEESMVAAARKRAASASSPEASRKAARRAHTPLTVSRPELVVNGSDREFRELVHNLFGFLTRHERIRAGHARVIGLAGIEYTVLISIAHLAVEGDVNVKTVADHLHLSGAFITSTVNRLVQLGLVHKKTDAGDRRRVALTVTPEGHALLERLAPTQRRVNDEEFGTLTRDEFRLLIGLVDRLIESADKAVALQTYLLSQLDGGG